MPPPDRYKGPREAIKGVMDHISNLYSKVIPLLQHSHPQEAASVAEEFIAVHDAMGRVKIGLLPKQA
jgi:hypothetical protein